MVIFHYLDLNRFTKIKKLILGLNLLTKQILTQQAVDCLTYLEKMVEKFVKKQKKKKRKICLLLSSGQDSRLLYKILEKKTIELNYKKNFLVSLVVLHITTKIMMNHIK